MNLEKCGNTVNVGKHNMKRLSCDLEEDHEGIYHRGDGYVWDDRCAWPEGQEPVEPKRGRR